MRNLVELIKLYKEVIGVKILLLITCLTILPPILEGLSTTFILPLLHGIEADNPANNFFRKVFFTIGFEFNLLNVLIAMVATVSTGAILLIIQSAVTAKALNDLSVKLRRKLIKETFNLNYQTAAGFSHGYLNHTIVNEANSVIFSFQLMATLAISLLYALVYTMIPMFINPLLVGLMMILGVLLLPVLQYINKKAKDYSKLSSQKYSTIQSLLIQALTNFKYLKATNKNIELESHINNESQKLGEVQYKQKLLASISKYGFEPFVILIVSALVYFFVEIKGQSLIECGFLLFLLNRSIRSVLGMQQNLQKLYNSWGSIDIIKNYLLELKLNKEDVNIDKVKFSPGEIKLECVSFSYGEKEVIRSLSLTIKENTTVAFVGESGSGKSTLVNLILGLLKPSSGSISLNKTSYSDLNLKRLRENVGYITQENVIFNDTFKNNISVWSCCEEKDLRKLEEVSKKAQLYDFIANSENKFDEVLGENGVALSGGQRQRVSIARELYKSPSILVCDESTSALDTATEKEIQKNIDEMKGDCTIILIAHRLSTVKNADQIHVLKEGKIIESGTYEELLLNGEEFKRMVELQS